MNNDEIRKQMELDQNRAFCKQSCTKIDQGLNKLDPRSGERAIWELFQNARDQARTDIKGNKTAHIKITLTPTEFIFAHQGRPFDHDSLTSLVMQVSSRGKENDDTVGQYGTGFLTTHVFGRKLHVTGSLDMGKYTPGTYADIDRFVIDRTYENITEFVDKVANQLVAVNDFAVAPKTSSCRERTELCYDLSSMEFASENAVAAIAASLSVIPYVMTVNKPISDVFIENKLTNDIYQFEKRQLPDEEGLKVMSVSIMHNGESLEHRVYYLESEDGEDIVILPFNTPYETKSLSGIAKLFVFFPLLGTENFGMDAIFHSKRFIPVEERDGLYLPVSNANVRTKYEQNIQVLDSLTEMVHQYYREHVGNITNWVNVSGLSFDCEHHKEDVTKDYFRIFKKKWSDFFLNLPMVDYNDGRISINGSNIRFFSQEIISDITDEKVGNAYFSALYDAAILTNRLVSRSEIIAWSKVVSSWDELHPSMIGVEEIAHKLGECEKVSKSILLAFDSYLTQKRLNSLFDTITLIQNRDGKLMHKSELRDAQSIPDWVCRLAVPFVPKDVEKFVDEEFISIDKFSSYSRNDLRKAINAVLEDNAKETFRNISKPHRCEDNTLISLAKLSLIVRDKSKETIRSRAMEVIAKHLGIPFELRELQALDSEEREFSLLPFKHLVENLFFEISTKDVNWMVSNHDYIYDLHKSLSSWSEYYNRNDKKGIAMNYACFPNMLNQPSLATELRNGKAIPEKLFELYNQVMAKDLRSTLVSPEFGDFSDFVSVDAQTIAKEIEDALVEKNFNHNAVLDIIECFDKIPEWKELFPRIAEKKADLFMKQVKKECKDGIFKLMKITDPDKLNQLAELANDVDFDEIIRKGKEALVQRKNQENDTEFKRNLGEYVERMIKKYLSDKMEDPDITVVTEFTGSDLSIHKNGVPVYYIEVKSRWGTDQSFQMTPAQMYESVEEADNYALCCVNMSFMKKDDVDEHQYPEIEKVLPYMKFVTNIGEINKEIADVVYGSDSRKVYVEGDFKCVVRPTTVSEEGINFNSFIEIIAEKLK